MTGKFYFSTIVLIVLLSWNVESQERPIEIRIDCREGVGLIPNFWKGISTGKGPVPEGARTVYIKPEVVLKAWASKRAGSNFSWKTLDELVQSGNGADIILPLPAPINDDSMWRNLVAETVRHMAGRVQRFEVLASRGADDRYLDQYESAIWAAYGSDPKADLGGPGSDWQSAGISALVSRCKERQVPLSFVSWQVGVQGPEDLLQSAEAVGGILEKASLQDSPEMMITGWHGEREITCLSSLVGLLRSDVEAICLDGVDKGGATTAFQVFSQLGRERLPMDIDSNGRKVEGIASLEGEEVTTLLWSHSGAGDVTTNVVLGGLPIGRTVKVQHYNVGIEEPIIDRNLEIRDPMTVELILAAERIAMLKLTILEAN